MYIKKDGFLFMQYMPDKLVIEGERIDETVEYINCVNISSVNIFGSMYRYDDIDFLSKCPSVSGVWLSDIDIKDYSGLYKMKNLTSLSVPEDYKIDLDMSRLKNLEGFVGEVHHVQNLDKCISLKWLKIGGKFPERNLEYIKSLTNLESLKIVQTNITSLNGIENLTKLRELELYYLRNLSDISAIKGVCDTLTSLEIGNCHNLCGYEVLGNLKKVSTLRILRCAKIPNISFVKTMSELKNFSFTETVVEDGDLTPCIGIEYTGFDNKKHYSHTFKELNPVRWKEMQDNSKTRTTYSCYLNDYEIEPEYYVDLSIEIKSKAIICKTRDNRGDNTEFKSYTFIENEDAFIENQSGERLPASVTKHEKFIEAMEEAKRT